MNKANVEKIIGYLFLVAGIGIIAYSAFNVISVFKGKAQPFDLFSFDSIGFDFSNLVSGPVPSDANLKQELVEKDLLNKPFNLFAHLLLMGFVTSAGFKIAQIGTMLVRSIKVKVIVQKEKITKT